MKSMIRSLQMLILIFGCISGTGSAFAAPSTAGVYSVFAEHNQGCTVLSGSGPVSKSAYRLHLHSSNSELFISSRYSRIAEEGIRGSRYEPSLR